MKTNDDFNLTQDSKNVLDSFANARVPDVEFVSFLHKPCFYAKVFGVKSVAAIHFVDNGFGGKKKVDCTDDPATCEYCQDHRPILKYNISIEDREDGRMKTLECGVQLFRDIEVIVTKYPNVQDYYIKLEKHGSGKETRYTAKKED